MWPLCIPHHGNIPPYGNSVCILFTSSELLWVFWLSFEAQIKISVEIFWQPCIRNLKYLYMPKLQILHIKYYLHIFLHDMSLNCTVPNLSSLNFNFLTRVEVDVSSKKLHTRKYFYENSCDHNHDIIYRSHLSSGVLNVILQLMPCQKTCK